MMMHNDRPEDTDPFITEPLELLQEALAGRYVIERELGRGGMAIVYLATDLKHGRHVAVKVLRPELAMSVGVARFLREIRIEARLQHPNIVSLLDSGQAGELPYYVMTYLEGESLRDRLRRERQLGIEEALRITREIGDALSYAHGQGVIHRDIKPGNILLTREHACLTDLGIARAVAAAGGEQLTQTGLAVGTPDYMSPEQGTGDPGSDPRSDLYSLSCVLYEMLAGEPPFTGRTPQAVIARHLSEPPPPLRVVRPSVSLPVQIAIERALAKVPADRFASINQFLEALEGRGTISLPLRRNALRKYGAVAAGILLAVAALALFRSLTDRVSRLDSNRVVVFPLRDEAGGSPSAGEGVATYIGYALEGTEPLKWLDGWDLLDDRQRSDGTPLSPAGARALSRRQRARYYIDGSIVRAQDSVTVVVRLHDVVGDSLVQRAGAAASIAQASLPQLGLRAAADLLPALMEPGRPVDFTALSERRPTAIAAFLDGEREYRRMHFTRALTRYSDAVAQDSTFALAALKGAQSAHWLTRSEAADSLVMVALRHPGSLPTRYLQFGEGLRSYLRGSADSAIASFRRALSVDSTWSEAWMALGEVYYHLLPLEAAQDSVAEAAFEAARKTDSEFTPPLFHLAEIALRRGDVSEAEALVRRFRAADPDATLLNRIALMVRCVGEGTKAVDWLKAVRSDPGNVLNVAKPLSVGAAQADCASAGFLAVFSSDTAPANLRWGALLGLQGLLAAADKLEQLRTLLDSDEARELAGSTLYLPIEAAGVRLKGSAAAVANRLGRDYQRMSVPVLWALGVWVAGRGDSVTLAQITNSVQAKFDSTRSRRAGLIARVLNAHLTLARGDSVEAIQQFAALTPSGTGADLEWQPWEALGGERITLASLYLSRRQFARAHDTAALLDAPQPVFYLTYLRSSLILRALAADSLGNRGLASKARNRLSALSSLDVARLSSSP